ncbi:MAG: 3-keto-disaccharide hydrolase [Mucilaginibacter sp.]
MKSLSLSLCCILILLSGTSFQPKNEWTPLLDKSLSKWEIYQSFRHKLGYKGEAPKDENGNLIKPIGYNINQDNVFSVIEENGEPVLHIDGDIYGSLFTKKEYGNYDLKLKVKWGTKKYVPRVNEPKDSGVLYHSLGECGVEYWRTWMLSQEFQVTEGGMGDYWSQASSREDVKAIKKGQDYFFDKNGTLTPFGSGTGNGGFCHAGVDAENKDGWNDLELITFGDKSIRIVNGTVVMALSNSRYIVNNQEKPLVKGKIQIQSEAAEVFYKDIKIRSIEGIPAEYEQYFK